MLVQLLLTNYRPCLGVDHKIYTRYSWVSIELDLLLY